MQMSQTLYVSTREEWRAWLQEHHQTEKEVWLIYYKKGSDRPRIPYDDAVEEALCFGWIDSVIQRIDDEKYAQKFTPRTNNAKWSASNIARMQKLVKAKQVLPVGLAKIDPKLLKSPAPKTARPSLPQEAPDYMEQALKRHPTAWENFQRMALTHRRQYIWWITSAKREETRQKRLQEAIRLLEHNQKLGLR